MSKILTMSEFKSRIAECYHIARLCGMTHVDMNSRLDTFVRSEVNRKTGTPGKKPRAVYSVYMQGFVSGVTQTYSDSLYQNHLEFCYMVNGTLFSTHKESKQRKVEEFYARNDGNELGKTGVFAGHYWKESGKLFFGSYQK